MAELRVNFWRQGALEALDLFRDFAKPFGVALGIAAARFITDDGKTLAERVGEVGKGCVHRKSLKRAEVWRKRPL
jgi:hypothetical protein